MRITRIYTGDDGQSHFEDIEITLNPANRAGLISDPVPTSRLYFRETGRDYDLDFHPAPRRQYVVNLTGQVELEIGSGEKRLFSAGDILLAEDTHGQGHKSRAIGDEPRQCLFIALDD